MVNKREEEKRPACGKEKKRKRGEENKEKKKKGVGNSLKLEENRHEVDI